MSEERLGELLHAALGEPETTREGEIYTHTFTPENAQELTTAIRRVGDAMRAQIWPVFEWVREVCARLGFMIGTPYNARAREAYYRRANRAAARSYRNQPSSPLPTWSRHHAVHNRKRNRHGRTGVPR